MFRRRTELAWSGLLWSSIEMLMWLKQLFCKHPHNYLSLAMTFNSVKGKSIYKREHWYCAFCGKIKVVLVEDRDEAYNKLSKIEQPHLPMHNRLHDREPTGKDDKAMQDGFGRPVDEDIYWHNSGLSDAAIKRVKEFHRTHPVQEDGTRLKDTEDG